MSDDFNDELRKQIRALNRANGASEMQNVVLNWLLEHREFYQTHTDLFDELVATMHAKHAIMAAE